MKVGRPDWLIEEPAEIYHAKARENLSSHQLADFRKCPYLYWKKQIGLIEDKDTAAFAFGRAAHTLILEGREKFENEYAVGGPINPKTNKSFGSATKAYAQWLAESGKKSAVTSEEAITLELMEQAVLTHPEAPSLITGGFAEGVVRTECLGVPCQARIDYFATRCHCDGSVVCDSIVDLKTCDDLTWFEADMRRYGYVHQLAFYFNLVLRMTGLVSKAYIIAVEKKEPFRCGVWTIESNSLRTAVEENMLAIQQLKVCQESGIFPTGYEQIRIYDDV